MSRLWLSPYLEKMSLEELLRHGGPEAMKEAYRRICECATQDALLWFIRTERPFAQMACDALCARDPSDKVLRQIIRSNPTVAFQPAVMLIARYARADVLDEIVAHVPRARRLAWNERCWRFPPIARTINRIWQQFPELRTPA